MLETFTPANPEYRVGVEQIFARARFIKKIGIEYVDCGPGWCTTRLPVNEDVTQHDGFVHAGAIATMADHTAGASAYTLAAAGHIVLTVEYKINLLRPGVGDALRCRAEVLRPGRTTTVSESSVYATAGGEEKLIAKALVTLALVAS